jgi:hypothetical protein
MLDKYPARRRLTTISSTSATTLGSQSAQGLCGCERGCLPNQQTTVDGVYYQAIDQAVCVRVACPAVVQEFAQGCRNEHIRDDHGHRKGGCGIELPAQLAACSCQWRLWKAYLDLPDSRELLLDITKFRLDK